MKLNDLIEKYKNNIDYANKTIISNGEYYYVLLTSRTGEKGDQDKWGRIITLFTKDDFSTWETIYSAITRWKIEANKNMTYMTLNEFNRM